MIPRKEFYFVRHGQTDYNILEGKEKGDHPGDIPLNKTGQDQALAIAPIIASLPVQTICVSPLKRALETKEIAAANLQVPHHLVHDLTECSANIWNEMRNAGMYSGLPQDGDARMFMERVLRGLTHALSLPGPALIIAHGGIHWAACCLMGIDTHEWKVENCDVVHFSFNTKWQAKKLKNIQ